MTPKGRLACVWGLGRFGGGAGAIRFLRRRGLRVRVLDKSPADNLAETVREFQDDEGIEWCLGSEDPEHLTNVDLVVVNPAIPDTHPLLQAIRRSGLPRTQEIELFLQQAFSGPFAVHHRCRPLRSSVPFRQARRGVGVNRTGASVV